MSMDGPEERGSGEFLGNLTGGNRTRGVSVEVGERDTSVDLTLNVPYGESMPKVT